MTAWCYARQKLNGWADQNDSEVLNAKRLADLAVETGRDDAVALAPVRCEVLARAENRKERGLHPGNVAQCRSRLRASLAVVPGLESERVEPVYLPSVVVAQPPLIDRERMDVGELIAVAE